MLLALIVHNRNAVDDETSECGCKGTIKRVESKKKRSFFAFPSVSTFAAKQQSSIKRVEYETKKHFFVSIPERENLRRSQNYD